MINYDSLALQIDSGDVSPTNAVHKIMAAEIGRVYTDGDVKTALHAFDSVCHTQALIMLIPRTKHQSRTIYTLGQGEANCSCTITITITINDQNDRFSARDFTGVHNNMSRAILDAIVKCLRYMQKNPIEGGWR